MEGFLPGEGPVLNRRSGAAVPVGSGRLVEVVEEAEELGAQLLGQRVLRPVAETGVHDVGVEPLHLGGIRCVVEIRRVAPVGFGLGVGGGLG